MISCCIDLDNQEILFGINGKSYGVAFSNFINDSGADPKKLGKPIFYYPAVSMDEHQHCIFNFGEKPFKFQHYFSDFKPVIESILNYGNHPCGKEIFRQIRPFPPIGGTPLHFSIFSNNDAVSLKLLSQIKNQTTIQPDVYGNSILDYIALTQNKTLFQACLINPDLLLKSKTFIHKCASMGNTDWCLSLLEVGFDLNCQGLSFFLFLQEYIKYFC